MIKPETWDKLGAAMVSNIIAAQATQGFTDTGKSARSLAYSHTANKFVLTGEGYFRQQVEGSRPWANKPPRWFVEIIAAWAKRKGIAASPYAIARKISRDGSQVFRRQRIGLALLEAAKRAVTETLGEIAEGVTAEYTKDIIVQIKW
jgi:hypothetical protein